MTALGRISVEFENYKRETDARIAALEAKVFGNNKKEKNTNVVIETKNDDLVAFDYES